MITSDGWLDEAARYPSVRSYDLWVPEPLGVVWHFTAGNGGPNFSRNLAESIQTYDRGKDRAASWHVLISKSGQIYQSVPFTRGAWHVGRPGTVGGKYLANVNRGTVGIELENAGRLRLVDGEYRCWPYAAANRIPAERAQAAKAGGTWDKFEEPQIAAAGRVLDALVSRYKWTRAQASLLHSELDPKNREDPGPLWSEALAPLLPGL